MFNIYMSKENQLPSHGWLHFCEGCGIITSKFIPKKREKINEIMNNSDIINICFKCQKNKKLVEKIFKKYDKK